MQKSCQACGAPQPENVQFEVGQNRDLITDAGKAASAAKGPDIHCPFCGTRNPVDAKVCIQCGGDLQEGIHRESGRVLTGGPSNEAGPVTCPHCGTLNPPGRTTCRSCGASLAKPPDSTPASGVALAKKESVFRPWMLLPVAGVLALICVIAGFFLFRTSALAGVVQTTHWQRVIAIEAQREITRETWRDQLPAGANTLSCQQEYRSRQDSPAAGATAVCSTQLVDQGNGSAKVVESCYYEIYDDYCKYQALEWQAVNKSISEGSDLQPYWPQVNLAADQREGGRTENYTVYFGTRDGVKEFTTTDAGLYGQLQPGTEWTLSVNNFGTIVSVSP